MRMGRLEFTTPREAWGGEATAFTPLLADADMLAYLGEATGLGHLALIETEHTTAGGRALDILAAADDGSRAAIENQYNTADHDHLTRGLAYAVATGARVLIVVAEGHRDEFVSVADYLNEVAMENRERGIAVWLVQVRAVRRVGDPVWSPEFVVKSKPNEWEAAVRADTPPKLQTLEEFYSKCEDREWSDGARAIVNEWLARPRTREGHNSQRTVGLYHESPRRPVDGSNVLQLDTAGEVYICRGFIVNSSGVYGPEIGPGVLDAKIHELFPEALRPGKGAYVKVGHCRDNLSEFLDWLTAEYTAALDTVLESGV